MFHRLHKTWIISLTVDSDRYYYGFLIFFSETLIQSETIRKVANSNIVDPKYTSGIDPVTCDAGFYVDTDKCSTCAPCLQGTYSAGGTVLSCTNCPTGKTVSEGEGKSETDCTWGEIYLLKNQLTTTHFKPEITVRHAQVPINS